MKNENNFILYFGKYAGKSVAEVFSIDRDYLIWVAKNMQPKKPIVKFIISFMKEHIERDIIEKQELNIKRKPHLQEVLSIFKGVIMKKTLKTGVSSAWCLSIVNSLEQGDVLTPRAREIMIHICGKSYGRRNSKKYCEITNKLTKAFEDVMMIK